jgi:hypothetical protein
MTTARRKDQSRQETELFQLMRNPFTQFRAHFSWTKNPEFPPWEDRRFPTTDAKRVWKLHREVILAHWEKAYPLRRPWAFWVYELNADEPRPNEQAEILTKRDLLTPHEKRLLAQRQIKNNP